MPSPTIYVASAGTGKTTALLNILSKLLAHTKPEKIAFTTFTNAGAKELAHRACLKFPALSEENFRYFRTLHSIAYRSIPYAPMVSRSDLISYGMHSGYPITGANAINKKDGNTNQRAGLGDHMLSLDSLMRSKMITPSEIATTQEVTHFSPNQIEDFSLKYRECRESLGKYDFTDMLEQFFVTVKQHPLNIEALLVDEAQDLSALQWAIVNEIAEHVNDYVIAGDDKQAIYAFNGGQPEILIEMEGERIVLDTSYRLPQSVLEYSEGIASKIRKKQDYTVESLKETGSVQRILGINQLDLSQGTWFFLARNRSFLPWIEGELMKAGVLFDSDNAEAILSPGLLECIKQWKELRKGFSIPVTAAKEIYGYLKSGSGVKRGGKKMLNSLDDGEWVDKDDLMGTYGLRDIAPWADMFQLPDRTKDMLVPMDEKGSLDEECRVRITTIHAVKGAEADNVVLMPDMTYFTETNYRNNPDDEHRVFYVGATRAKENLFLHAPLTERFYPL